MINLTRYILVLLFLTSLGHVFLAQRFSTGVMLTAIGYHNLKFEDRFVFSPHSYVIYYAGNEKRDFEPSYGQTFNGFGVGLNFNVDYKRYMLSLELLGGENTIKTSFIAPTELNNNVYEKNTIEFEISKRYTSIGILGLYKLSTKANGLFVQLGCNVSFTEIDENTEFKNVITFMISPYEMYGTLYTNQYIYLNGVAGLGWKWNNSYLSGRFSQRIQSANFEHPSASIFQIDVVYSRTLSFQKLRKGYKIYLEK